MDIIMRDLLDTQAELKAHKDALVGIANDLGLDEEIVRIKHLLFGRLIKIYGLGANEEQRSKEVRTRCRRQKGSLGE